MNNVILRILRRKGHPPSPFTAEAVAVIEARTRAVDDLTGQLRGISAQMTLRPIDYNGHMPADPADDEAAG